MAKRVGKERRKPDSLGFGDNILPRSTARGNGLVSAGGSHLRISAHIGIEKPVKLYNSSKPFVDRFEVVSNINLTD